MWEYVMRILTLYQDNLKHKNVTSQILYVCFGIYIG